MEQKVSRISYGKAPKIIGRVELSPSEHMIYLYLPVKMPDDERVYLPKRLRFCDKVLTMAMEDAAFELGYKAFEDYHVYLSVKTMIVGEGCPGNRPGWHADGFGSNGDLNYVWYDMNPTQFVVQSFDGVSEDDRQCLSDLTRQANPEYVVVYPPLLVLRCDESVVHRVNPNPQEGLRTFVKVSISKKKYNLRGNSHNYLIDYNWEMHDRQKLRNTDNKDFVDIQGNII
jgi:hypothetical protein